MSKDTGLDQALESATDYEPLYHYNGEVELLYSHALHARVIVEDGVYYVVPGVTSVLGMVHKEALVQWAATECSNYVLQNIPEIVKGLPSPLVSIQDLVPVVLKAKTNFRTISKTATDIGHIAHKYLEEYIKARIANVDFLSLPDLPEHPKARNCVVAALKWFDTHNVQFEQSECHVYSREYNYAGTLDWKGTFEGCGKPECCGFTGRVRTLGDFKSSKRIYDEYRVQLAAYKWADEEEHPEERVDNCVLMRLDKEGGEKDGEEIETLIIPATEFENDFNGFLGALTMYNWERQLELDRRYDKRSAKELAKAQKLAEKEAAKALKAAEKAAAKAAKVRKPRKVVAKGFQPIGVESAPPILVESISTIGVETLQ
jgi:hypothetical protein